MECRPFEVKLISANDIRNVNRFTTMDVYSFVLIAGDPRTRQRSPTDRYAGTSPKWNYSLHFTVDEADLQKGSLTLVFLLRSERPLGDRDIGEVHIPLKELLHSDHNNNNNNNKKEFRLMTCNLQYPKIGKQKGTLDFSYLFGDKFTISSNPTPFIRSKTCPVPPRTASSSSDDENEKENQLGMLDLIVATEDGGFQDKVAISN